MPKTSARRLQQSREWRERNPDKVKAKHRRKLLKQKGLTQARFDEMLVSQEERCAVCRSPEPGGRGSFHIDHDHATGRVRGLLCHHCNVALGSARDNPSILRAMADYLEAAARG